jgi:hypothetical protein
MTFTAKDIEKAIGADFISLVHEPEEGYWYFIYNDGLHVRTKSVPFTKLSNLPFEEWVQMGNEFNEDIIEDAIEFESHKEDWRWENIADNH